MKKIVFFVFIFFLIFNFQLFSEGNETTAENERDQEDYKVGLEFSIGLGTALEFNFDIQKRLDIGLKFEDIPNETFYDFDFFQLNIPFSMLINLKKNNLSFGFSFIYSLYNFSYTRIIESSNNDDGNYGYSLNQSINLNFKFKLGNFSKYINFVSELGFIFEYYYSYYLNNHIDDLYFTTDYLHTHLYELFIGPRVSAGLQIVYNHFSFEFGGFIGYLRGAGYMFENETNDENDVWIKGNGDHTDIYNRVCFGVYMSCNFSYLKKLR